MIKKSVKLEAFNRTTYFWFYVLSKATLKKRITNTVNEEEEELLVIKFFQISLLYPS